MSASKHSVIVISAPSGVGKSTLNLRLIEELQNIELSISHTTRAPRTGEQNGIHYHYIDEPEFKEKIKRDEFIEWAHVHTSFYGTSFDELQRIRNKGHTPLLEIDVQGWLKICDKVNAALSIFIIPPSLKVLWERLSGRGSETIHQRLVRFKNAIKEIENSKSYQYIIVNDQLEIAYQELKSCVQNDDKQIAESTNKNRIRCQQLLEEYKNAEWINELNQLSDAK